MKTFENVCSSLVRTPKFAAKIGIGVLLGLFPVINFLSLGYLMKFGRQEMLDGTLLLPDWRLSKSEIRANLKDDFINGFVAFLEFFLFMAVPVIVCSSVFGIINREEFGACLGLFIGAPAFAYAVVFDEMVTPKNMPYMFKKFMNIYKAVAANYKKLVIPAVLFLCLQVVACLIVPCIFMGAVVFFGMVFLVAYVKQMC